MRETDMQDTRDRQEKMAAPDKLETISAWLRAKRITLQEVGDHLGITKSMVSMALAGKCKLSRPNRRKLMQFLREKGGAGDES